MYNIVDIGGPSIVVVYWAHVLQCSQEYLCDCVSDLVIFLLGIVSHLSLLPKILGRAYSAQKTYRILYCIG